jgi:hypothetical protein
MNGWPNFTPPPYYGQPYGPTYVPDNAAYTDYLKKELKRAKRASKEGELKKKDEKKKLWWTKAEVIAILFFTAPFLGPIYLGILTLSWWLTTDLILAH